MTNPYSPPTADDLATTQVTGRDAHSFGTAAAVIVCANSLAPLFFASFVTGRNARIGMVAGLVITLIATVGLGVQIPRLRPALRKGGIALALSQFFPLIQLFAGVVAINCCINLGIADDYSDDHPAGYISSAPAGLVCTLITAMILSGFAVLVGFPLSRAGQLGPINSRGD